jgi:hypothetical protein
MKLLIIGLLFSFSLSAQTLDTAQSSLSLKGKEWLYFFGSSNPRGLDSLWQQRYWKLQSKVKSGLIAATGTVAQKLEADILIDTVYIVFQHELYKTFASMPSGQGIINGTNWRTKISAVNHSLLVPLRVEYNTNVQRDYEAVITRGKWETFDKQ